jgi:hypothetical protein
LDPRSGDAEANILVTKVVTPPSMVNVLVLGRDRGAGMQKRWSTVILGRSAVWLGRCNTMLVTKVHDPLGQVWVVW